jgi:hypothetical protein
VAPPKVIMVPTSQSVEDPFPRIAVRTPYPANWLPFRPNLGVPWHPAVIATRPRTRRIDDPQCLENPSHNAGILFIPLTLFFMSTLNQLHVSSASTGETRQ